MIGRKLKSLRHLARVLKEYTIDYVYLSTYDYGYMLATCVKTPRYIFMFNSNYRQDMSYFDHEYNTDAKFHQLVAESNLPGYCICVPLKGGDYFCKIVQNVTYLGEDFKDKFLAFASENKRYIESLGYSSSCMPNSESYIILCYILSGGSKHFFEWSTNLSSMGVRAETIKYIMEMNDLYPNLSKNLSKGGTMTAYKDVYKLRAEMMSLARAYRAKEAANKFNTVQKKILRDMLTEREDVENALNRFYLLTQVKQFNFVKKVSSIEDEKELVEQIKHATSSHFDWTKESVKSFIENVEGMDCAYVFETDDVLVVNVRNYDSIKHLGKTTNWCISKNKTYWNNYIGNTGSKQYVLFNFNEKEDSDISIVGFTVKKGAGIVNAHDFVNHDLVNAGGGGGHNRMVWLNSLLPDNSAPTDIYSILNKCGVDLGIFMKTGGESYEWNKDGALHELFKHVSESCVRELTYTNGKLVLEVISSDLYSFLPESMRNRLDTGLCSSKIIIFFDFTKPRYVNDSMMVCLIGENKQYCEYCNYILTRNSSYPNVYFEGFLQEYGLPYNVIKRPMDDWHVFKVSFCEYLNTYELARDMNAEDFKRLTTEYTLDTITSRFGGSIFDYASFDYLNMLYDKGLSFNEVFGIDALRMLADSLASKLLTYSRVRDASIDWPTDEVLEMLKRKELKSAHAVRFLVICKALDMLIDHEKDCDDFFVVFNYLLSHLVGVSTSSPEYTKVFAKKMIDISETKKRGSIPSAIGKMAYKLGYKAESFAKSAKKS